MTLPDYIAHGGDLVFAPPFAQNGTTMYTFLVAADYGALTRLVDSQLNAVTTRAGARAGGTAGGPTIYKPLLPMAAVVCANITQGFSTAPADADKGWNGEFDFGVWIPVVAGTVQDGTWKPGRISWYLPYVFVDNPAAMATGREVYGFFKQTATLIMPSSPAAPGRFSIDALVIETFTHSSQAQILRLLTVSSREATVAPEPPAGGHWTGVRDATRALWGQLKRVFFDSASAAGLAVSAWDVLENLLEDLVTGDVPMVFLKQFRDAVEPGKACYQAVIEAPAHLDKFHAGWFVHPHDVAITPCASHPIAAECGLAGPVVRSELGFWCKIDFTMQPGKLVAQTS